MREERRIVEGRGGVIDRSGKEKEKEEVQHAGGRAKGEGKGVTGSKEGRGITCKRGKAGLRGRRGRRRWIGRLKDSRRTRRGVTRGGDGGRRGRKWRINRRKKKRRRKRKSYRHKRK